MQIRYCQSLTRILYTGYVRCLDRTGRPTMPTKLMLPTRPKLTRRAAVLPLAVALAVVVTGCSSIKSGTPAPSDSADNRPARNGGAAPGAAAPQAEQPRPH